MSTLQLNKSPKETLTKSKPQVGGSPVDESFQQLVSFYYHNNTIVIIQNQITLSWLYLC